MADDMDKWTKADFKAALEEQMRHGNHLAAQREEERQRRIAAESELKEAKTEWADLKIRLHAAESVNQQMRGYIQRVQEDDVVREDLIAVGDPQGEQQMVPKRKQTQFPRPDDFTMPAHYDQFGMCASGSERRRNAKHWINY